MTALEKYPPRHAWTELPMRTAMATFWPPTEDRLRFMKQLGIDDTILWATTFPTPEAISFKELLSVRTRCEAHGLKVFAVESVSAHFYDKIVLGKDGRDEQIESYKRIIQAVGRAGIPVLGYNWMINGVWRSSYSNPIRGGAKATAFDYEMMRNAPLIADREYEEEEFWDNYEYFIRRVLPAAEAEGVKLAIHPNDPPVERLGGLPCLMRSRANIDRALSIQPSDAHGLTFCLGNWGAMGADLVDAIRHYGPLGKLLYVHFQATRGTIPAFTESFVDDADYDPIELIEALDEVGFNGVMIPGHVPQIEMDIEWRTELSVKKTPYHHPMGGFAARAFTIGYLKATISAVRARRVGRQ
ncbi:MULTISPECIES: mannonate dehydratase [unclassified Chelatococcus]|uniref:mannonate dehydratase n=1 Tax=unclassified Chelatococcus TaxID=2638111 RepID=UPI001BCE92B8|nr:MULTISPECIES: mannonate dehydratase [unclassified Chelatococcus]MBS7700491.1 mannonate dehydratase [Chelatococcus sp. YT9]MBX3556287.1 mannonate dehydratase [Chelatococcus sp.]